MGDVYISFCLDAFANCLLEIFGVYRAAACEYYLGVGIMIMNDHHE